MFASVANRFVVFAGLCLLVFSLPAAADADLEITGPISAVLEIGVPMPVAYTIRNNGPLAATNVIGVVSIDAVESVALDGQDCPLFVCEMATLASGQSVSMIAMYRATSPEPVPMYATVYANGSFDPNGSNNWLYLYGYVRKTFVVSSTSDALDAFPGDGICADATGACTIQAALTEAAISPAPDAVHFAIGSGPQTIVLTNYSLYLSDDITIDGTTQPGHDGTPLITIDGSALSYAHGVTIYGGRATIRGLALRGFNVGISCFGGSGHSIVNNSIGPDVFNPAAGILIEVPEVTVAENVIAGHALAAVDVRADDCIVRDNRIGTDASGMTWTGSPFGAGVRVSGASRTRVLQNVIAKYVQLADANDCLISRNRIGVSPAGTSLGNRFAGIYVQGERNRIEENEIAFNARQGIVVWSSFGGNTIRSNAIHDNALLGIDLGGNGVTPNGAPVLTLAQSAGGTTHVQGALDSAPNTSFVVEFFVDGECDPSGFGEGRTHVGRIDVATNASGHADLSATFAFAIASSSVMTATATDAAGNTSEFSACTPVVLNRPPAALCRDVTVLASASCDAVVTAAEIDAGSWDADGDALTLTLSPSGPFGTGTTSVALTATDPSGAASSCEATVTVVDETLPEIACPADLEIRLAYGETAAEVTYDPPVANDNCPAPVVSCDIASGSVLNSGTTYVTCTATDASGNVATCTFSVTLLTAAAATERLATSIANLVATGALPAGNGAALSSQLDAALRSMALGNATAATHQLEAFIAHVEALIRAGQLAPAAGEALIAEANAVLAQLS